jgi:hypothetical protein
VSVHANICRNFYRLQASNDLSVKVLRQVLEMTHTCANNITIFMSDAETLPPLKEPSVFTFRERGGGFTHLSVDVVFGRVDL